MGATQQGWRPPRCYALALMKGLAPPAVGVVPGDGLDAVAVRHLFYGAPQGGKQFGTISGVQCPRWPIVLLLSVFRTCQRC